MATENLNIKITADVQDAVNKVKAVKDNLTDLNNNTGISSMTSNFKDGANAASELADKLSSIRNMNIGSLISGFANISASMRANQLAAAKLVAETNYYEECVRNSEDAMEDLKNQAIQLAAVWNQMKSSGTLLDNDGAADWDIHEQFAGIAEEYAQYSDYLEQDKAKLKSLSGAMDDLKASGTGMFAGLSKGAAACAVAVLAVVAAVGALTAAIKSALNAAQRLRTDFFDARKVGLSTQAYQEWSYVLGQVGVEADALSDFIKSLSAAQNDLRDGSEAMTEAFKQLGFNIDEVVNMGQEELFVETIKRLQQMENQVQRTSIAYRIFGEDDASKVANVLALNNQEMERMINNYYLLGGGASDAAIQKSLALSSAVSNMKLAWQGLGQTIGEFIMPLLTKIVNAIAVAIAAVNMFLRALFGFEIVAKGSSSSGINKASSSIGGYTDSVKEATAAAKELKRTTMGFDELNVVSNPNTDAGGGSGSDLGSIGGGGGSFEMPEISGLTENLGLEKIAAFIEKWKGVIQTVIPIAMVAIGVIGGIACLFAGNFLGAAGFFAMAGIGIAIGNSNGLWENLGKNITQVWEDVKKKAKKKWDEISKNWVKFWDNVGKKCKEGLDNIKKWFEEKWKSIKDGWTKFCEETKKKWDTFWSNVSKAAKDGLEAVKKWFDEKWKKIKEDWNKFIEETKKNWNKFWTDVGNAAKTGLEAIKKWFVDGWNKIKTDFTTFCENTKQSWDKFWSDVSKKVSDGLEKVKKFFSDAWESIKTTLVTKWNEMKAALEEAWSKISAKADELCANLKKFFEDAWKKIQETWSVVEGWFQDIWDAIDSAAEDVTDAVGEFWEDAWDYVEDAWDGATGWFQGVWNDISSGASGSSSKVSGFFSSAWSSITNVWGKVVSWFQEKWSGISGVFSGVKEFFGEKFGGAISIIQEKWKGIKEWFAEKWKSIKDVFTTAGQSIGSSITTALKNSFNTFMSNAVGKINNFIGRLNSAIDLINKIPGVNIGKIGTLPVPQLAKGGIVTDSILANIGERGREAVLPLENNTGWMDILADRIAARNGAPSKIILQVDGKQLGWATIDNINAITKQTGGLQLTLV